MFELLKVITLNGSGQIHKMKATVDRSVTTCLVVIEIRNRIIAIFVGYQF